MNQSDLIEIAQKVVARQIDSEPELLTIEEMNVISRTDIRELAERLPIGLSFEIQWYYYENRKRTNEELLEEVNEQIKELENVYGNDFETEFGHLTLSEADSRNDASNYFDWLDLINQKNYLSELIKKTEK